MVLTANNENEARLIINALKAKGWEFKLSCYWSQEWVKDDKSIWVHKSMEYDKKRKAA